MREYYVTAFNLVQCCGRVLDLNFDSLVRRQNNFIRLYLEVGGVRVPKLQEQLCVGRVLKLDNVARCTAEFTLEKLQVLHWAFVSSEGKVVPELTHFFIQKSDIALNEACLQGTEDQVVC